MRAENGIFGGSTWPWVESGSAWCLQNIWEHYAFTGDQKYLRTRAYPMMKEVCEFWLDRLKALPDGTLVAPNGYSPEHGPREDGVSHDQQLIWDLFNNTVEAAVVNIDWKGGKDVDHAIASPEPPGKERLWVFAASTCLVRGLSSKLACQPTSMRAVGIGVAG